MCDAHCTAFIKTHIFMGWKALHCETKHGDHYDFFPFLQSCWVRNTGQGQKQLSTLTEIFETLLKIHFGKRRDQERILHFTHTYIDLKKNILQFGQICFIALPSSITTITSPTMWIGLRNLSMAVSFKIRRKMMIRARISIRFYKSSFRSWYIF